MGQQQLLLIILGVIVVGIAVAVGITMFSQNAVSANRDAVVNDLVNFAARAQQYYRRPTTLGGGQGSFLNLTKEHIFNSTKAPWSNGNGSYTLVSNDATTAKLLGLGTETGNDGTGPVKVTVVAYRDSVQFLTGTADSN